MRPFHLLIYLPFTLGLCISTDMEIHPYARGIGHSMVFFTLLWLIKTEKASG